MTGAHKSIWRTILFSYVIACYCSRIPAFFIDWQKGVPSEGSPPSFTEEFISFLLSPILAPIALFVETSLAFVWGIVMFERLLPLLTFILVGLSSWMILNKRSNKVKRPLSQ